MTWRRTPGLAANPRLGYAPPKDTARFTDRTAWISTDGEVPQHQRDQDHDEVDPNRRCQRLNNLLAQRKSALFPPDAFGDESKLNIVATLPDKARCQLPRDGISQKVAFRPHARGQQ